MISFLLHDSKYFPTRIFFSGCSGSGTTSSPSFPGPIASQLGRCRSRLKSICHVMLRLYMSYVKHCITCSIFLAMLSCSFMSHVIYFCHLNNKMKR